MRQEWYFKELGELQGPVSAKELVNLACRDDIGPETLVLLPSYGKWLPACRVKHLFERAEIKKLRLKQSRSPRTSSSRRFSN